MAGVWEAAFVHGSDKGHHSAIFGLKTGGGWSREGGSWCEMSSNSHEAEAVSGGPSPACALLTAHSGRVAGPEATSVFAMRPGKHRAHRLAPG